MTEEENAQLKGVALRLRELQAAAENEPGERRREILKEELVRRFAEVPAEDRKRCLEMLLAQFAKDGQASDARPTLTPEEQECPADSVKPQTLEQGLSEFLALAAGVGEEERLALAKRLASAGVSWVDRDQWLVEVADDLRQALGLAHGQQPRLGRMVQLTVVLIELLNRLDQMALKTYNELSSRGAPAARPQDFRQAVASYLTGNSDSLDPQIRSTSALLGGLMAAMLGAGREFGRQYVERFAPSSIEDVVKVEGKAKLFRNEKALCWEKYKDLARDYATVDLLDRRFKESLGAFAEKRASAAR